MANIYIRKDSTVKPYIVQYKDPCSLKFKKKSYATEEEATLALNRWRYIESLKAVNDPSWTALYYKENPVLLSDVFTAYRQYNQTVRNADTVNKSNTVMKSVEAIFDLSTPISSIRTMTRTINGQTYQGWEIYKKICEDNGRVRSSVNKYLSELKTIFDRVGNKNNNGLYDIEVVTKYDKYNKTQLEPNQIKIWNDDEIYNLFNKMHLLDKCDQQLITVLAYTGIRSCELAGIDTNMPIRNLTWDRVDFHHNTIHLVKKMEEVTFALPVHQIVMDIFQEWYNDGNEQPFPYTKQTIYNRIVNASNKIGIDFRPHDLRRLRAQVQEYNSNSLDIAGAVIGDSSASVIKKSYAHVSDHTMKLLNQGFHDTIINKTKTYNYA